MFRYVATAAIAALLLAVALRARGSEAPGGGHDAPAPSADRPDVRVQEGPDGLHVTVTHLLMGNVSRASLVYHLDGEECTAARRTDCGKSVAGTTSLSGDGFTTRVQLTGTLPRGASRVRLVLEAETGTTVLPVELN